MAARKKLEEQVQALAALRAGPLDEQGKAAIARALESKSSVLVAAAAKLIGERVLQGHTAALVAAFERFLLRPVETDKGCLAKVAIARALQATSAAWDAPMLRAVRHVQLEPVWGGKQDTAVELRGVAAAVLVQNDYPDVMHELARLLADPEPMARVGAAQALGLTRHVDAAVALLRFKVHTGDADSRVLAACLASLLAAEPASSLPFVTKLLESGDVALRETAAIALGESRLEGALAPLVAAVELAVTKDERRALLLGIALLRSEAGRSYLLERIAQADEGLALLAIEALAVFRHDDALRERVLEAAGRRTRLRDAAREAFD